MAAPLFDVDTVRAEFPLLTDRKIDDARLVYLDSGNTSQKPRRVIDAMSTFMEQSYAPINRSSYRLAGEATEVYEGARRAVARLINAPSADEVVFTKNATEAMNLIAMAWGRANLHDGDAVVLTEMEHHANIVPWQMLAQERAIDIRWIGLTSDGQLDLTNLDTLLDGAKVLSFTAMSNVLGTIPPTQQLCAAAHAAGAIAVVDACQFVPHNVTDVQAWDADLVAFSSHKMCGPTGIGMLWGKMEILDAMPPFLGGGNMIDTVTFDGFTTAPVPAKFEAGTPAIVEAAGLTAAIEFLEELGMANIRQHEMHLTRYTLDTLQRPLRRRDHDLRPGQRRAPRRRVQLRVPRPPPARREPGARRVERLRARRPSLCQAVDEDAQRQRDHSGERVPLQRRSRHRCTGRRPRRCKRYLRLLIPGQNRHGSNQSGSRDART